MAPAITPGRCRLTDEALKVLQNDATLHEFRALVLFAVGRMTSPRGHSTPCSQSDLAGTGRPWPVSTKYRRLHERLRKLEAFVSANRTSTAGRFVLAYHYLTQGNTDAGVSQFKEVVALTPQDTLSAQLVKQFSPPATVPDAAAATTVSPPVATTAKQGNLAGNWTAHPAGDTTIDLRIGDDENFTWKVTAKGKPQAVHREMVTHRQPAHAGSGRRRRSIGRPCLLASRQQVELPRHRGGCRGSGVALYTLNAGASD